MADVLNECSFCSSTWTLSHANSEGRVKLCYTHMRTYVLSNVNWDIALSALAKMVCQQCGKYHVMSNEGTKQ
jgi:hypothetical protein